MKHNQALKPTAFGGGLASRYVPSAAATAG